MAIVPRPMAALVAHLTRWHLLTGSGASAGGPATKDAASQASPSACGEQAQTDTFWLEEEEEPALSLLELRHAAIRLDSDTGQPAPCPCRPGEKCTCICEDLTETAGCGSCVEDRRECSEPENCKPPGEVAEEGTSCKEWCWQGSVHSWCRARGWVCIPDTPTNGHCVTGFCASGDPMKSECVRIPPKTGTVCFHSAYNPDNGQFFDVDWFHVRWGACSGGVGSATTATAATTTPEASNGCKVRSAYCKELCTAVEGGSSCESECVALWSAVHDVMDKYCEDCCKGGCHGSTLAFNEAADGQERGTTAARTHIVVPHEAGEQKVAVLLEEYRPHWCRNLAAFCPAFCQAIAAGDSAASLRCFASCSSNKEDIHTIFNGYCKDGTCL